MTNTAIIVAAGAGKRMNIKSSKLLLDIDGKTVIERTVEAFDNIPQIDEIIVVIRECDFDIMNDLIKSDKVSFVFGGDTRQQSVMNAIDVIDECDMVVIHDGARPFITRREILDTLQKAKDTGAAATGVYVKDTVKVVDDDLTIKSTPDRAHLVAIRTPQIFSFDLYQRAVENAKTSGKEFTDDCALVENIGADVAVVIGEYTNIKITTPDDIIVAQSILKGRD